MSAEKIEHSVRGVLSDVLGIDRDRVNAFNNDTPLLGAVPELDSMAVANLLTELEDRLGITIEDDEVDAELFESFGRLLHFVTAKAGV